ncbi:MAG: T9SS type A sorting domain-containing protein, partial [Muribaculaceae bacterium]|nr:T9SS type A sorting domain-containing protein [Muribaculaceae bacterium]
TVIKKASGVNSVLNDAAVRLSVYPNPTTGIINITSPEPVKVVNVFNSTGAVVAHSTQASVDLSGLTNGIYFVKVNNLNTVKVVKR